MSGEDANGNDPLLSLDIRSPRTMWRTAMWCRGILWEIPSGMGTPLTINVCKAGDYIRNPVLDAE